MDYKALYNFFANAHAGIILSVETLSEHKMNKRGNALYGRVTKAAKSSYQFGYDYESAINRRLTAQGLEPSFKTASRPWGQWLIPNKIAEHKGELYLRLYTIDSAKPEATYLVDGRPATKEEIDIIDFFTPSPAPSNKQAAAGLSAHQVQPREVKFSSIQAFTCGGQRHIVQHPSKQEKEVSESSK